MRVQAVAMSLAQGQQANNNTARTAAALPGSARTTTEPGTPSNAGSTDSNATRAAATRCDKPAVRFEAILHIAVFNDWLLTSL
jgi:hypothetical protein